MSTFLYYASAFVLGFALGKAPMMWTVIGVVASLVLVIAAQTK
jgi:hypothetical protein